MTSRIPHASLLAALGAGLALAVAAPAGAEIRPPLVLEGPSSSILDVSGAALAPDGSGGVVYRRLVDGLPHLFAVRFSRGSWSRPIRVDAAQRFAAASPTVAAGANGRLLVVWATPWAVRRGRTRYALMSATLEPGGRGFGQAIEIDPRDVGDGTAAYPSLAMSPGGSAYVVYRVITNPLDASTPQTGIAPMRPGDAVVDVRVARYNGMTWSSLGNVNRLEDRVTMRRPSAVNAPAIAVNRRGDGAVVTWQEPGLDGIARIWARRLFGTTVGTILPVSPATLADRPVLTDAEAPTIAVSQLSEAKVGFRLLAGSASGRQQLLVNALPPSISEDARAFAGAELLDSATTVSPASIALDADGGFRAGWTADGAARIVGGGVDGREQPRTVAGGAAGELLVTHDPEGGGAAAWRGADADGRPVVKVLQEFADGTWQSADSTAPLSGTIDGLAIGEADRGDALVAYRQGPSDGSQVVATLVSSEPSSFSATVPDHWVRPAAARVRWSSARTIAGRTSYTVLVDGQTRARGISGRFHRLQPRGLGDGVHLVEVLASDESGQQKLSSSARLRIDANPPRVTVRRVGRLRVEVLVRDAASGLLKPPTRIDFGEPGSGRTVGGRARARHRYRRAGRYVVTVRSRDRVGHRSTWRVRVQAR